MPPSAAKQPVILIGADPELFVKDKSTGKIVSAHDRIPGDKVTPFPVSYGAIQVDGVAAEFNIEPSISKSDFWEKLSIVQQELQKKLGDNYSLEYIPANTFDDAYWDTLPDITKVLGCNPDYNAWTGTLNPTPDGSRGTMRTAAGHIHLGWTKNQDPNDPDFQEDCNRVVRELDYMIGLPSLIWDRDNTRRLLYGKAGACRYKPYGVEYRVPSNAWLKSQYTANFVWTAAYNCIQKMFTGGYMFSEDKRYDGFAKEYIDSGADWVANQGKLSLAAFERQTGMGLQHLLAIYEANKPKEPSKKESSSTDSKEIKPKRRARYNYASKKVDPNSAAAIDAILDEIIQGGFVTPTPNLSVGTASSPTQGNANNSLGSFWTIANPTTSTF